MNNPLRTICLAVFGILKSSLTADLLGRLQHQWALLGDVALNRINATLSPSNAFVRCKN